MPDVHSRLTNAPIVPLVQADDPEVAIATAGALADGGLTAIEVVLRTHAALECLSAICAMEADLIVGAGAVLSASQATEVLSRGAKSIVSPGLDESIVRVAPDGNAPRFSRHDDAL